MAPTSYTIHFVNRHKVDGQYAVFTAKPEVADEKDENIYTNVWQSYFCPGESEGFFELTVEYKYYAWAGTVPVRPAPNVVVTTGSAFPVDLGDEKKKGTLMPMTVIEGTPTLKPKDKKQEAPGGSFEIKTDSSFKQPNDTFLVGLALIDKNGLPSPIATVLADNKAITRIKPKPQFYIARFSEARTTLTNMIVDFTTYSTDSAHIEFPDGKNFAVVVHDDSGNFHVDYSSGDRIAPFPAL